jgi:hypothetical protein
LSSIVFQVPTGDIWAWTKPLAVKAAANSVRCNMVDPLNG